jgi:hypothetical protein
VRGEECGVRWGGGIGWGYIISLILVLILLKSAWLIHQSEHYTMVIRVTDASRRVLVD